MEEPSANRLKLVSCRNQPLLDFSVDAPLVEVARHGKGTCTPALSKPSGHPRRSKTSEQILPLKVRACLFFSLSCNLLKKNVLINDRQDAVITDFGLSRIMEANPQYRHSDKKAGSIRWMAPELLEHNGGQPGTAADVYSYGMLAFEVRICCTH